MLKSLEKLRSGHFGDRGISSSFHGAYELADEIQAEVDEKYMPRAGAAYQMLADPKLDDEAVNSAYEILKEYGTLDAYIDKFYLPRPLFEDGEPVQVGDYVDLQCEGKRRVQVTGIEPWIVYGNSTSHQKEPYKRPPEPDSQEKIDEDLMLKPSDYCAKRGLDFRRHTGPISEWPDIVMRKDLLARQRKLDEAT